MERKREFMDQKVWSTILMDYIVPFRHLNSFSPPTFIGHKDSEPLLDKQLPNRLRDLAAVAPDMFIDIYSNGVLLPKWKDRGQDFIEFLSTLPNKVRYMMSHHPNNHDYTVNDYGPVVAYLKNVLRNRPSNVEFITVSHRSRWVTDEMQASWRETWKEEAANRLITVHSNCSINPWTGLMAEEATCKHGGCPYADAGHTFFGVTGNIIACCMDLEEEIVFGNVMTDEPQAMMDKLAAFYAEQRRRHAAGEKPEFQVCYDCFGHKRTDLDQLVQLGGLVA